MEAVSEQPMGRTLVDRLRERLLAFLDLPIDPMSSSILLQDAKIDALELRIEELEAAGAPTPPPQGIVEPGKTDYSPWTGD